MTENQIQTFTNEQFGQIRTVLIDGEPWFVGRDFALFLGYANPAKAIRTAVMTFKNGYGSFLIDNLNINRIWYVTDLISGTVLLTDLCPVRRLDAVDGARSSFSLK